MHTTALEIQPRGSAPTTSCLADNLAFQVDVTLGLAPCTITEPNTTKFAQKLRDRNKWAHKKAEAFQAKEAETAQTSFRQKG